MTRTGWRVDVHVDSDPSRADEGDQYISCTACLAELRADPLLAATFSPLTYARQQASVTKTGEIQVRCSRHGCNVVTFTMRAVRKGG